MRLLRANDAAIEFVQKFTGYRAFEGNTILDIPTFNPERPIMRDIQLALAGARNVPERVVNTADGSGWLEFSYSPVFNTDGSILGAAVSLRDVTEKKRMEQTRMHALRLESMGLLAGGIAHDFNNLLAAIIGNIEVARLGELDSETRAGLDDAHDAARRASELVRELLAFAGKQAPVVRRIELSALTREMVRYARKIPGHQVEVLEEFAENLPELEADATQIRQVALNLVVNALEATRATGGAVYVRTYLQPGPPQGPSVIEPRPAPSYVAHQVRDEGHGMDAETRERIWDPFFTTKETGHGLGLPSVLGAVRSHGGCLAVESEPGRGATFTVYLPAAI
jgi:PAS domain S-box-containing protein